MKFSVRDMLWLTALAAVLVAWWIDRSRLAIPFADYHRLKTAEEEQIAYRKKLFSDVEELKALLQAPKDTTIEGHAKPKGLRPVPGDEDYQFPPSYPLHYDRKTTDDRPLPKS